MAKYTPIDFGALNAALLQRVESLLARWLPAGVERNNRWYVGDFDGSPGESANVNMLTGQWIDNSNSDVDKGGDLVSLYARVHNVSNYEAAKALMLDLGWDRPGDEAPARPAQRPPAPSPQVQASAPDEPPWDEGRPPEAAAAAPSPARGKREPKWRAVLPVPPHAPKPGFTFGYKDKKQGGAWVEQEAVKTWEYRFEGQLYGYVARFERIDSSGELVKDTIARTWCEALDDGQGHQRWHWKQWEAPRPLYVPATILSHDLSLPVVLVEGEKCAEAGFQLLGHEFDFVTWPGGCAAWAHANWFWLVGRTVYLWPDCDAQRERLSKDEKEAGIDPKSKPLKPPGRQPGLKAMVDIGTELQAKHGCQVLMCRIPAPGKVADGWDIADAIAEGWDAARVRDFIRGAVAFESPNDEARAKVESTPPLAGAGEGEAAITWRKALLRSSTDAIKQVRENVVLALDGMQLPDGRGRLLGIEEAQGVIAYNQFTNDVMKLKPAPWGSGAGRWEEVDELLMGEWLVRQHWLPSMPRGTLEEATLLVARRNQYHPVRSYLEALVWDGVPRLATWLRRACLLEDEWDDRDALQRYLARAGTWFLQGMVTRVMQPGVKFDYMLILEGAQGMRKSTLLRVLAGEYFADTGLVLGDKDSYQQLQGRWLYEFSELDSFGKAEVTKIKSFIASASDYFRASFDRRARDYPRQLVFGGSTNEDHYLTDPTGNRRFWPVRVTRVIDIDWVAEHRDQLFAEAMSRWRSGARMYPTDAEEKQLFKPQQELRAVDSAIESSIGRYLYDNADGMLLGEVSLVEILGKIGIGLEKLGPGRWHEKQAGAAMRKLGWSEHKSSRPGRPLVFRRPSGTASAEPGAGIAGGSSTGTNKPTQGKTNGGDDDCPF